MQVSPITKDSICIEDSSKPDSEWRMDTVPATEIRNINGMMTADTTLAGLGKPQVQFASATGYEAVRFHTIS